MKVCDFVKFMKFRPEMLKIHTKIWIWDASCAGGFFTRMNPVSDDAGQEKDLDTQLRV